MTFCPNRFESSHARNDYSLEETRPTSITIVCPSLEVTRLSVLSVDQVNIRCSTSVQQLKNQNQQILSAYNAREYETPFLPDPKTSCLQRLCKCFFQTPRQRPAAQLAELNKLRGFNAQRFDWSDPLHKMLLTQLLETLEISHCLNKLVDPAHGLTVLSR